MIIDPVGQSGGNRDSVRPSGAGTPYDLAVAYRVYPGLPKRSPIFSDDKLRFAELCARSLKESLGPLRTRIWVILDGCPPEYKDLFQRIFPGDTTAFVELDGVGNAATFALQMQILADQDASPYVYCAEDDYLYTPGTFEALLKFLKEHNEVDFVSPYDHPSNYGMHFAMHPVRIRYHGGFHWRGAGTTCLTFLARQQVILETRKAFSSFSRGNFDASLWLSLTKFRVFRPDLFVRYLFTDRLQAVILAKAWVHCWRQILTRRRYSLWTPMPSIATHMERAYLAPGVDWPRLIESLGEKQGR